jgi:hypothetical protein
MHTETKIALNPGGNHLSGHVVPQTTTPQYKKKYFMEEISSRIRQTDYLNPVTLY